MDLAALMRTVREEAGLTQSELAARAGTSQPALAALEGGRRQPSFALVSRLLAALGLQLRLEAEPLYADVDAGIDAAAARPLEERVRGPHVDVLGVCERLTGKVPFVLIGPAAALVHGGPLEPRHVDVAVLDQEEVLVALFRVLHGVAKRWVPRWREWFASVGDLDDFRRPQPTRWLTCDGELRVHLVDRLPAAILIRIGDTELPVAPLDGLSFDDPEIERVVRRLRERSTDRHAGR